MRHAKQVVISQQVLGGVLAACIGLGMGCSADVAQPVTGGSGNSNGGTGSVTGTGGSATSSGGSGVTGSGGSTGTAGGTGNAVGNGGTTGTGGTSSSGGAGACTGATDPRLVVAPQRLVRLTLVEVVNSIRDLFNSGTLGTTEATTLTTKYMLGSQTERTFPPLNSPREGVSIISDRWSTLDQIGQDVGQFVLTNFTALTACPATPTDACATTYLNTLAAKIYRRPLDTNEQTRLTALYNSLKSQVVNGITITATIQEATQNVVSALLGTPQFLYRSELGSKTAAASTSPPGVALTPYEVATQLSYFLTDTMPDQPLLDAAKAGTLTTDAAVLTTQVNRLLGLQTVKDNLRTAIYTYYKLNLLPNVGIDPTKFPQFNQGTRDDMGVEGQKFLDYALWNGNLVDLLTSRTTFLNSNLATNVYKVPVPAGATVTNFVQTTLPTDQRSGIITNAGFITSRARTDTGSIVARGLVIKDAMLCLTTPPPPEALLAQLDAAKAALPNQTAQEQVKFRADQPACAACHAQFDAYGLVLENYDAIGTWRTVDDQNRPVDPTTSLPSSLGGGPLANAIDLASILSTKPAWVSCMAKSVMQYALTDVTSAPVDVAGCAVADVTTKYNAATTKTFTELVRDVATAKTILIRAKTP